MSENSLETSSSESFTSSLRSADGQTIEKIYGHPAQLFLQDGKRASGDPAASQTSWTDEKHSLYLNYIEDAFVTSLYDRGYYGTYFGKSWQADSGETSSANTQNLTKVVESGYAREYHEPSACPEESQSESDMAESHPDVVNHSNSFRSKEKRHGDVASKKQDTNVDSNIGRIRKRKSGHEFNGGLPGPQSARHSPDHQSAISKYQGQRQVTENRQVSDPSAKSNRQEDQVVPSMEDLPGREDVRL